jgi:hypothetical protein
MIGPLRRRIALLPWIAEGYREANLHGSARFHSETQPERSRAHEAQFKGGLRGIPPLTRGCEASHIGFSGPALSMMPPALGLLRADMSTRRMAYWWFRFVLSGRFLETFLNLRGPRASSGPAADAVGNDDSPRPEREQGTLAPPLSQP